MNTSSSNNYSFCKNCGKPGHMFHQCKFPITSIGIIAFRASEKGLQYLMICRKDSLGYVDFIRGKYPLQNKQYLLNIINEMTTTERENIQHHDFDTLWYGLWGNHVGIQYRGEEKKSRKKFNILKEGVQIKNDFYNLDSLIKECCYEWDEPEWGFPKGRRDYNEKDMDCALREFEEETGLSKENVSIVQNIVPIEEIFTGSNYKSYKHKYYMGFINDVTSKSTENYQKSEVSKLEWKYFDDCIQAIRPYNLEKIDLIRKIDRILNEYQLYR